MSENSKGQTYFCDSWLEYDCFKSLLTKAPYKKQTRRNCVRRILSFPIWVKKP